MKYNGDLADTPLSILKDAYRDAAELYRMAEKAMTKNGCIERGPAGGIVKSPHVGVMKDAVDMMVAIFGVLESRT